MRTSQMIKSKFWRAADLQGQPPVTLTIATVTEELMSRGGRQDMECFLWFKEHLKGLKLNKTRIKILELAYGPDSDLWTGERVRLSFDPTVIFGGQAVGGVKLETPPGRIYQPSAASMQGAWGTPIGPTATANAANRPPQPVWDANAHRWVLPAPPPPKAAPTPSPEPPPPIWNESTGRWDVIDPHTGEIQGAAPHPPAGPPPTISQRVNAAHPPADDFGPLPPDEFNDAIPDF